ncbi:hypothetical protein GMRT_10317 [Giardia muris]|uniref:Uncharacterized protein n=1 Tax=Giardia muris TaxID=5742 RepID=A0A4Z1SVK0_GIAMU|nr:hypothetical protein GMRT_10317 [Giardia muris]|eukprot:TNJ29892.1 hypothetical protein GMRT_10317 [Giardia muris]
MLSAHFNSCIALEVTAHSTFGVLMHYRQLLRLPRVLYGDFLRALLGEREQDRLLMGCIVQRILRRGAIKSVVLTALSTLTRYYTSPASRVCARQPVVDRVIMAGYNFYSIPPDDRVEILHALLVSVVAISRANDATDSNGVPIDNRSARSQVVAYECIGRDYFGSEHYWIGSTGTLLTITPLPLTSRIRRSAETVLSIGAGAYFDPEGGFFCSPATVREALATNSGRTFPVIHPLPLLHQYSIPICNENYTFSWLDRDVFATTVDEYVCQEDLERANRQYDADEEALRRRQAESERKRVEAARRSSEKVAEQRRRAREARLALINGLPPPEEVTEPAPKQEALDPPKPSKQKARRTESDSSETATSYDFTPFEPAILGFYQCMRTRKFVETYERLYGSLLHLTGAPLPIMFKLTTDLASKEVGPTLIQRLGAFLNYEMTSTLLLKNLQANHSDRTEFVFHKYIGDPDVIERLNEQLPSLHARTHRPLSVLLAAEPVFEARIPPHSVAEFLASELHNDLQAYVDESGITALDLALEGEHYRVHPVDTIMGSGSCILDALLNGTEHPNLSTRPIHRLSQVVRNVRTVSGSTSDASLVYESDFPDEETSSEGEEDEEEEEEEEAESRPESEASASELITVPPYTRAFADAVCSRRLRTFRDLTAILNYLKSLPPEKGKDAADEIAILLANGEQEDDHYTFQGSLDSDEAEYRMLNEKLNGLLDRPILSFQPVESLEDGLPTRRRGKLTPEERVVHEQELEVLQKKRADEVASANWTRYVSCVTFQTFTDQKTLDGFLRYFELISTHLLLTELVTFYRKSRKTSYIQRVYIQFRDRLLQKARLVYNIVNHLHNHGRRDICAIRDEFAMADVALQRRFSGTQVRRLRQFPYWLRDPSGLPLHDPSLISLWKQMRVSHMRESGYVPIPDEAAIDPKDVEYYGSVVQNFIEEVAPEPQALEESERAESSESSRSPEDTESSPSSEYVPAGKEYNPATTGSTTSSSSY